MYMYCLSTALDEVPSLPQFHHADSFDLIASDLCYYYYGLYLYMYKYLYWLGGDFYVFVFLRDSDNIRFIFTAYRSPSSDESIQ